MKPTNYRFRCETADDFGRFLAVCHRHPDAYLRVCSFRSDQYGGDAEVSSNLTLEGIRGVMRKVPDGHVMVQTVAKSEEYTGDRDFDVPTEIEYPTQVDCRMFVAGVELRELHELGEAILNGMADDLTIRFRILEAKCTDTRTGRLSVLLWTNIDATSLAEYCGTLERIQDPESESWHDWASQAVSDLGSVHDWRAWLDRLK